MTPAWNRPFLPDSPRPGTPAPDPRPSDPRPSDPPAARPDGPSFTQSCCGNILITAGTPGVLIWERDPSMRVAVVQATVYALPDNAEPLRLLIESDESIELDVAPGNTVNYLSPRIRRLLVTVPDAGPSTYAEGKYAVSVSG